MTISDQNTIVGTVAELNAAGVGRRSNATRSAGHDSALTDCSQCKRQGRDSIAMGHGDYTDDRTMHRRVDDAVVYCVVSIYCSVVSRPSLYIM